MSEGCCVVFITVDSRENAEKIADALVSELLAACCNLVPGLLSIYRWKGEIHRDPEVLLMAKTRRDLFERLRERAVALHGYEVPEVVALPIVAGHEPYLDWIRGETVE